VRANDLDFAYGLFGLREKTPQGISYTHDLGYDLSFRLVVSYRTGRGHRSAEELRDPLRQLLASIWAWIHLGGVGARTRRGFGALELAGPAVLEGLPPGLEDLASDWRPLLAAAATRDFEPLLVGFRDAAAATNPSWPPLLYLGSEGTAIASHKALLEGLRYFRQAVGFARDPGTRFPGQSRWPEPNLMRLRRDPSATWEHLVPESVQAQQADLGAPRAAFGLPIVMHFKSSGHPGPGRTADSEANGQILPPGLERWASPLLLRPVRSNGGHRPLVALLGDRVPDTVQLRFDKAPKIGGHAPVAASAGAASPIGPLLQRHGGRALEAFASWLVAQHTFAPLSLESPRG
jgi:CRISPR-associated protein Cmr1